MKHLPVSLQAWHAAVLLLDNHESCASSLYGMRLVVSLVQQLAGLATPPRVLASTSGVLGVGTTCDAAHGGVWGFARVLRLEHPSMRAQSIAVSRGSSVAASPTFAAPTEAESAWGNAPYVTRLRLSCYRCGLGRECEEYFPKKKPKPSQTSNLMGLN